MPCHSIGSASPVTRSVPPELAGIEIIMSCNSGCESSVDPFGGTSKIRGMQGALLAWAVAYICMGLNFSVQIYYRIGS